jgi:hypothetical protein
MEQYIHLLIARPDDFVPSRPSITSFCQTLVEKCVVPNVNRLSVSTPSGKVRTVNNPFTGEMVSFPMYAHQRLEDLAKFEAASHGLANYCLHLEGEGRPEIPPVPISFEDPYSVVVRCHVTAVPHSTSAPVDDELSQQLVQYDQPCDESTPFGYFTDPTSNKTIEVADAGRAQFWMEFELGKSLFPETVDGNLELLNPAIVRWAESEFGVPFAQGCHYF